MLVSNNGMIGGLDTTVPIAMILSAFSGIAWYICIELNIRIFMVFKRYKGLYFWSMLLSSWGALLTPVFDLLKFFQVVKNVYVISPFILTCWCLMVTGQSLVLYSRLHLIVPDTRRVKFVLFMIIFDALVLHVPIIMLAFLVGS